MGATGLQVHCCANVESARLELGDNPPQLILLGADLLKSNPAICRTFRSCASRTRLPILLLVPQHHQDLSACLCTSEVDDFIRLPFLDDELQVRVLMHLKRVAKTPIEELPQVDYRFLAGISNLANSGA